MGLGRSSCLVLPRDEFGDLQQHCVCLTQYLTNYYRSLPSDEFWDLQQQRIRLLRGLCSPARLCSEGSFCKGGVLRVVGCFGDQRGLRLKCSGAIGGNIDEDYFTDLTRKENCYLFLLERKLIFAWKENSYLISEDLAWRSIDQLVGILMDFQRYSFWGFFHKLDHEKKLLFVFYWKYNLYLFSLKKKNFYLFFLEQYIDQWTMCQIQS